MTQTAKRTAGKTAKGTTKAAGGTRKAAGATKTAGGATQGLRDALSKNPAAERLMGELQSYVRNRATDLVGSLGDRIGDTAGMLDDLAANAGGGKKSSKGRKGQKGKRGSGDSGGKGSVLKLGTKMLGGAIKNKVGDLLPGGGSDRGSSDSTKATVVEESIDIGVPVGVAYNQWTQFQEFGRFSKGVQSVNQEDEVHTNWKAKVAFSNRSWDSTITEQVPDQRIAWTSDGSKGSVDGVVTFHELAPNLTRVLLELEYHPKGVMEKTGNLWRAQGRRARLDLKNFRHFVMVRGEETGSWRGEIRDSEVVHGPDEDDRSDRDRGRSSRRRGRRENRPDGHRREHRERREERPDRDSGDTGASSRSTARRRPSAREHATRRSRGNGADEGDKSTATNATTTTETAAPSTTGGPRKKTTPATRKAASPRKKTTSPRKKTTSARKTTTPARKKASAPARKRTTSTTKKTTPARKKTTTTRKTTTARRTSGGARKTAQRRR